MTDSIKIMENRNSKTVFEKYTVDQAIEGIGYGPFHRKLCILSGSSIGNATLQLCFILTTISKLKDELDYTSKSSIIFNQTLSSLFIGQILGGLLWSNVGRKYGRSKAFFYSSLITSLSLLISSFMTSFSWLLITRFFAGIGLASIISVDYQMFLEFTLISKIQISHLYFVTYWVIAGIIISSYLSWILVPLFGMKITSMIYTMPSFVITYLKYKWKHESPRYLVKEHKIFSAADELYVMAEENNTTVPNGSLIPTIDEGNDIYNSTIKNCFKPSKQQKHSTFILINLFGIVLTLITGIMHISLLKSTTTNDENKGVKHIIMNENFTFINLLWSIINLLSIPIVLVMYNKFEKYQRHIVLTSLFIISGICYLIMAITSQFYVVCILSIPILFTIELGFAILFHHMIDSFIPTAKSSGFSLIIYAIATYSLALINIESIVIDYFVSIKSCLIITSIVEIVLALCNLYGFTDIIERKYVNSNLSLNDLESGSLINQENLIEDDEEDDEEDNKMSREIKEDEIEIKDEILIEN
ncbi:MFS general substrate transporter [Neocallimastix lanati (nom. inval.)]|jgi:MFS family permease|uniref:MFS general substrate transporter n=1 Tax=Neocallimastix californiae TaxID=1754190 RepID=A0A1Y2FEB1_9FUNG|nr:MFS general substrate transporter [Neocallimastix sp. JGI-2020a]ORY81175.1 MFS general substrate transporter [Neocallimastix californiae]|eukprot:ORY81175.1 MFS general substrate transporter [Neocallimastix californiae]